MSTNSNTATYLVKIGIVGDPETGKTQLLNRFVKDSFCEVYYRTLGVDLVMA